MDQPRPSTPNQLLSQGFDGGLIVALEDTRRADAGLTYSLVDTLHSVRVSDSFVRYRPSSHGSRRARLHDHESKQLVGRLTPKEVVVKVEFRQTPPLLLHSRHRSMWRVVSSTFYALCTPTAERQVGGLVGFTLRAGGRARG
jgi:hypothetical protein